MGALIFRTCDRCGYKMIPQKMSNIFSFDGKELEIKGIEGYKCEHCGEIVYESKEIRMIDKLIHALSEKTNVDVLNLDETAAYLRVSNQTIYNMIRDGRIKAHKVGRELRFLRGDIMAYLDSASNDTLAMAAKGGKIDQNDFEIIQQEIDKRRTENE